MLLSDQMLKHQKLEIIQVLFWKNAFNSLRAVRWEEIRGDKEGESA